MSLLFKGDDELGMCFRELRSESFVLCGGNDEEGGVGGDLEGLDESRGP